MADAKEQSNQLNLAIVALVALVAIVGLAALVLNTQSIAKIATSDVVSGDDAVEPATEFQATENLVGDKRRPPSKDQK